MKYLYNIGMTVAVSLVLAATSCSDFADYNTTPTDEFRAEANKTLYENIQEIGNISNFARIISKAGYTELLNSPQSYTMWIPKDGSYNTSEIESMSKDDIVKNFINMHMAQYMHPTTKDGESTIISLNNKHHKVSSELFDDHCIDAVNRDIPATNGLIHLIDGTTPYLPNIYEYLGEDTTCLSFKNHVKSYDIQEIDGNNSVKGPMVNGKQTYEDTVWIYRNDIVNKIMNAQIDNEDSTYITLFPTDEAWRKADERISPLYKYIAKTYYMDVKTTKSTIKVDKLSATDARAEKPAEILVDLETYCDSLTKYHIMRNLSFSISKGYDRNIAALVNGDTSGDSIFTTSGTKISNAPEVLEHCGNIEKMSNGGVRVIDSICFKPWETFEPMHSTMTPIRVLPNSNYLNAYTTYKDSVLKCNTEMFSELPDFLKQKILPEDNNYFSYIYVDSVKLSKTDRPEYAFALKNVLSTKYHIYVVLVPAQLKDPSFPMSDEKNKVKDMHLRFDMAYTDTDGNQQYKRINVPGANKAEVDIIVKNDGKFHVVELEFTFPICYYNIDAFPTMFMSLSDTPSFISTTKRNMYDRELRCAGVFLVPEGAYDYVQSLKF